MVARSLVWPVLVYGSEAWSLTKANTKRIEAAEMWVYRGFYAQVGEKDTETKVFSGR